MCQFLASIDWFEFAQAVAAIGMLIVASMALSTWKVQAKAHKQTDFLDELTDYVHEYLQKLSAPIELLKLIKIQIESYENIPGQPDHGAITHIAAFIEAHGVENSERLWATLHECNQSLFKINSLVARGQVYGFKNFGTCRGSIKMLTWQHNRLQAVAAIIGDPNFNWDNPEVAKTVQKVLDTGADDIEAHIEKHNVEYIGFVNENYKVIYKGT